MENFYLPVMIVYFLSFLYWRDLWQGIAVIILLILPMFTYLTIKDINKFSRENNNGDKVTQIKILIKSKVGPGEKY